MSFLRHNSLLSKGFALGFAGMATIAGATKTKCWEWIPANYEKLEQAERKILEKHIKTEFEMKKVARLGTVVVPCSDETKKKNKQVKDLVLFHGFASGNAFWAANFEDLAKHFNVYAVEWIGVGRSDRPDFNPKSYEEADKFIVQAFEDWRKEMKLEEFHLCAHSMGAIFATSYALQYAENIKHLVLVSPAGVGHPPPKAAPRQTSWLHDTFVRAWEDGYTPMSLARGAGPYGPKLVLNILQKRISFMPPTSAMRNGMMDVEDLAEYIYHNWALKASGEKTMSTHLAPFALARRPLIDQLLPEQIPMPITFIYGGESDWMDFRYGLQVVEKFKREQKKASLHLIPSSGHQVFLDNPAHFNQTVITALLQDE